MFVRFLKFNKFAEYDFAGPTQKRANNQATDSQSRTFPVLPIAAAMMPHSKALMSGRGGNLKVVFDWVFKIITLYHWSLTPNGKFQRSEEIGEKAKKGIRFRAEAPRAGAMPTAHRCRQ